MVSFQVHPAEKTKEPTSASERAEARAPRLEEGQCWRKMRNTMRTATAPRMDANNWAETSGSTPSAEEEKATKRPRTGISET